MMNNSDIQNEYKGTAHLYDLDQREMLKDDLSFYLKHALKELLISCGFKIISEFGYYDERRLNEGTELIYVCEK